MVTREQPQESEAHKRIAKGGDSRAAQPRGGYRDNSQRGGYCGKGNPPQLDGVHQEGPPSPSTTSLTGYWSNWD